MRVVKFKFVELFLIINSILLNLNNAKSLQGIDERTIETTLKHNITNPHQGYCEQFVSLNKIDDCCDGRNDSCFMFIQDTRCYCDAWCTKDCCSDASRVCKNKPLVDYTEIKETTRINGNYEETISSLNNELSSSTKDLELETEARTTQEVVNAIFHIINEHEDINLRNLTTVENNSSQEDISETFVSNQFEKYTELNRVEIVTIPLTKSPVQSFEEVPLTNKNSTDTSLLSTNVEKIQQSQEITNTDDSPSSDNDIKEITTKPQSNVNIESQKVEETFTPLTTTNELIFNFETPTTTTFHPRTFKDHWIIVLICLLLILIILCIAICYACLSKKRRKQHSTRIQESHSQKPIFKRIPSVTEKNEVIIEIPLERPPEKPPRAHLENYQEPKQNISLEDESLIETSDNSQNFRNIEGNQRYSILIALYYSFFLRDWFNWNNSK